MLCLALMSYQAMTLLLVIQYIHHHEPTIFKPLKQNDETYCVSSSFLTFFIPLTLLYTKKLAFLFEHNTESVKWNIFRFQ